jgi:hypothetical protein
MADQETTDFLVDTGSPELLDDTLHQIPNMHAVVLGRGTSSGVIIIEGYYVVRVLGDTGWFRFAVEGQGYCKIIRQLDNLG